VKAAPDLIVDAALRHPVVLTGQPSMASVMPV
jgi:hypothetical protein